MRALADTSLFIAFEADRELADEPPTGGLDPLPIDDAVASAWAGLIAALRAEGKQMRLIDSRIAATAIANGLPVATQDTDFDEAPGLNVIRL